MHICFCFDVTCYPYRYVNGGDVCMYIRVCVCTHTFVPCCARATSGLQEGRTYYWLWAQRQQVLWLLAAAGGLQQQQQEQQDLRRGGTAGSRSQACKRSRPFIVLQCVPPLKCLATLDHPCCHCFMSSYITATQQRVPVSLETVRR